MYKSQKYFGSFERLGAEENPCLYSRPRISSYIRIGFSALIPSCLGFYAGHILQEYFEMHRKEPFFFFKVSQRTKYAVFGLVFGSCFGLIKEYTYLYGRKTDLSVNPWVLNSVTGYYSFHMVKFYL